MLFSRPMPPVTVSSQAVYTRTVWAGAWVPQPDLFCTRLTVATGETLSSAVFRYRSGIALPPGESGWQVKPVLSINPLAYVRVDVSGTDGRPSFRWYGTWRSIAKEDEIQSMHAIGLETWLDEPCRDSPWWDGAAVRWAGRGLVANANMLPNRSADKHTVNGVECYVFEGPPAAEYWTTRDLVEHLLACAAPKNAAGEVVWHWTPIQLAMLPDWDNPTIDLHGPSFLTHLRELVPRYKLLGWCVEPYGVNELSVRFQSFAASAYTILDLAGEEIGTIPANNDQQPLIFSEDPSSTCSISTDGSNVADQVIVTGARRRSVCSLWHQDDTLDRLWTEDLETEYIAGASGAADYPPAEEPQERDQRDRDARAAPRLASVFRDFGPPQIDWDQMVNASWAGEAQPLFIVDPGFAPPEEAPEEPPEEPLPEDPPEQFLAFPPTLSIERSLPLRRGYEYHDTKIEDNQADDWHRAERIDGDAYDELPVYAFALHVTAENDLDGVERWLPIDQIGCSGDQEPRHWSVARHWSGDAQAIDEGLGVSIRVQGAPQHMIAAAEMFGLDLMVRYGIIWQDDLIVTASFLDPRDVEIRYPADEDLGSEAFPLVGELVRRLRIELPDRQLARVVPGTITGVDPETLELQISDGGIITDDRQEMLLVAQRTFAWHRVPRYVLRFSTGWIDGAARLLSLITYVIDHTGTYPVNTVITEVTLEFPVAQADTPPRPAMHFATSHAELDVVQLPR